MSELRKILLIFTVIFFAGFAQAQQTLRIAAAADLQPLLPGILTDFTAQTGIHAEASYQSSATLATQIVNGAPFDVFMAADLSFPQRVIAAGLAEETQPTVYAQGTLVLWTRNDSGIKTLSMETLRDPAVKSIAVANAEHAPYGRAAQAALTHLGLYDELKPKLVVAENIAQTAQYVDSGNAQAGFLSLTSAMTPRLKASGHFILVPRDAYPPILQGVIVIKRAGADSADAHRFLDFLASAPIVHRLEAGGLAAPTGAQAK
ncbi:molybdate transport system substrate-binding protein [Silvibacterium bohemicum]|uniref:Molybdate transport system substrate-binding protein n=1 Tax=Silvibacterium bohemicum TaxID=1577686 RepID=A0A841JZJ7_9BACT|nr:molybdate ABC transporter substrate-binding protein [Silvibacterium bohemicum]MBB6146075.1 molybdate transport system substrate-binding protein [Silvibacterium bohemicum]